jgi:hypothetical protein
MRSTSSPGVPPRRSGALGDARKMDATPMMQLGALPSFMTYGLRASIAVFIGATRSAPAGGDVDPADLYGDFA